MRRQVLSILVVLCPFAVAMPAEATTRHVSTTGSDWSNDCTATPCLTVAHAVSVATSGDVIEIGAGTFAAAETLAVDKSLTLSGHGSGSTYIEISTPLTPLMEVGYSAKVKVQHLVLRNGHSAGYGGCIFNAGMLTLKNVHVENCVALYGGGIYTDGLLILQNAIIQNNTAHESGGGLYVSAGTAAFVFDTKFKNNTADNGGGGILATGGIQLERSLLANNEAGNYGGAMATWYGLIMNNTTVSGNTTMNTGAISVSQGEATLTHVTITANVTTGGLEGGLSVSGKVMMRNSILAGNSGNQCSIYSLEGTVSAFVSAAGSIVGDTSCNAWPGWNQIGVDPKLGPLAFHNGPTQTYEMHGLLEDSPAIDAALKFFCLPEDQRQVPRPIDGDYDQIAACDIGAYELQPGTGGGGFKGNGRTNIWKRNGPWFPQGNQRPGARIEEPLRPPQ